MIYEALGASEDIGASCHFLQLDGTGLLLDTGTDPEAEGLDSLPRLNLIDENPNWSIDHAIVSHAHHDHIGSLPVVLKHFPHALVHMTGATRQLADILLPASARLQARKMKEGVATAEPVFNVEDIEACSYLYTTHELDVSFDVTGLKGRRPVRATLKDAGHILGACGILIEFEEGDRKRRLFYTGDTSLRSQTILPGAEYPEPPIDILLLEATLGADAKAEQTSRPAEEIRFGQSIAEILKVGGIVLVPVFALGRGQEIIALIDRFRKRGVIPEDTPLYTAGLMRAISDVYDKTRFTTPRLNQDFEVYGVPQRRLPRSQSALTDALSEPGIYLVGSGMMFEKTISNRLAQRIVGSEKDAIFLVGYAKSDSPARLLHEASLKGPGTESVIDRIVGPQEVHCRVDRFRFSGHSHRRDLIQLVEKLQPKKIVLVHGEIKARDWMMDNIRYFYPDIEIVSPRTGQTIKL